jgi:SAM-dependent methyltransferase
MLSVFDGKLSAEDRGRVTLEHLDLAAGGHFFGSFDVILAAMLLHHVADPLELVKRFMDHLSPGGYLCLADLDSEDGSFHDDPTGISHHGFDRGVVASWQEEAGLAPLSIITVSTIDKQSADGAVRSYPVFLSVAMRP